MCERVYSSIQFVSNTALNWLSGTAPQADKSIDPGE